MALSVAEIDAFRPKQARSRARRANLIEHGITLLETCELDEFSIAEITGALGFSTGSFYSYFPDKEAYFVAIQEWVNETLEGEFASKLNPDTLSGMTLVQRFMACVSFSLDYFRHRNGVIRSALRYERRIPQGWAPNRKRTTQIIAAASAGLKDADRERLETALQLAFGLMVNALLHDPGPLRLDDQDLPQKVLTALAPYLEPQNCYQNTANT